MELLQLELRSKVLLTTEPDAITQLSPIITPSRMVTFAPIQQFFPILMPFLVTLVL